MNYEKLVRKVQTAGTWFTGVFLREILRNYPVIVNDKKKRKDCTSPECFEHQNTILKTACFFLIMILGQ